MKTTTITIYLSHFNFIYFVATQKQNYTKERIEEVHLSMSSDYILQKLYIDKQSTQNIKRKYI